MRQVNFDIGQCLARAVQYLAGELLAKGLTYSFDVRGPRMLLEGAEEPFSRTFHRLLKGGLDVLQTGLVLIQADTDSTGAFHLRIGGLGRLASAADIYAVLARLELPLEPGCTSKRQCATGVCYITGAAVDFVADHGEGFVIDAGFARLPVIFQPSPPSARGARAWVFGPAPGPTSIAGRLARLGWDARPLETSTLHAEAVAQLSEAPPHLVIALDGSTAKPRSVDNAWVNLQWPVATRLILGVPRGSPFLRDRGQAMEPWEVWPSPFSPLDLERLTAEHQPDFDVSCLIETSFSEVAVLPKLLVVDDNPTNRRLASAAARLWGYEAVLASDGRQALDTCMQAAPHAVLMDVDMPVMDGMTATRVLRAWQTSGRLPPFPILAVTADTTEETRRACLEAGMEMVLHKPLVIDEVAAALRQLCPQAPVA